MPWWATIYLFLFVAFSVVGDGLSLRDDGFRWRHICDCVAHLIFAVSFAGYWLSAIFGMLGLIAPALFVAALGWEIYSAPADLREIWHDAAVFVSPEDADEVAAALCRLIENSSLRAELAARARRRATDFSPERMTRAYLKLYDGMLIGTEAVCAGGAQSGVAL